MSTPTSTVPHPIHLAPASTAPAPTSYIVIRQSQQCRGCGNLHQFTEIYAKTNLRPQMGLGKYVTNLRPIHSIHDVTWNLPIELHERPIHEIPFCHECYKTANLSHLPSPPAPEPRGATIVNSLAGTAGTAAAKPKAPKFGIDDL